MKRLTVVVMLALAAMLVIPAMASAFGAKWEYDIRVSNSQSQTTDAGQSQTALSAWGGYVQQQGMAGGNSQFSATAIGTVGAVGPGGSATVHASLDADLPGHPDSPHINAFTQGLSQAAGIADVKIQGQRYSAEQGQYASGPALFTGSQSQSESQRQSQSASGRRAGGGCIGSGC